MENHSDTAQRLFGLINAAWTTRALAVAAELRLAEALSDRARSAHELADALDCDPCALQRLLRALTTVEVCAELPNGRFELLPLGQLLAEEAPQSLRAWALQFGRQLWPAWQDLDVSVRTGKGVRERAGETDGFSHLHKDASAAGVFNRAMVEITRIVAPEAVRRVDQGSARRIVDVGGGHGQLLAAFLARWPAAVGVVLDLEHAAAGAESFLHEVRLADRAAFACGDFFESIPAADVLLMKAILHDWSDERCAVILRNARRALSDDGRLLIFDRVMPDRLGTSERDRDQARSDLTMLIGVGGRERTQAQLRQLLFEANFAIRAIHPLPLGISLLDSRPL